MVDAEETDEYCWTDVNMDVKDGRGSSVTRGFDSSVFVSVP